MNITYCESMFVALGIQQAGRMCHIIMWPTPLYNIFVNYLTNGTILENALLNTKFILIFCTTFV